MSSKELKAEIKHVKVVIKYAQDLLRELKTSNVPTREYFNDQIMQISSKNIEKYHSTWALKDMEEELEKLIKDAAFKLQELEGK